MAFRILYIVIGIAALLLGYDTYRLYSAYSTLDDVPAGYSSGPDNADLTVVEFLSYGCEWCRAAHPTITEAVKQDGHVRYIPRPIPTEDEQSVHAGLLAYTAGKQGGFMAVHNEMMENYRAVDDASLVDIATRNKLDLEKLGADLKSGVSADELIHNGKLFNNIGGSATPTFVIGRGMIYVPEGQMPTVEDFLEMFKEARAR